MNRQPIIDIHNHMWRTPEIGRQALLGLNRNRTYFEWTGTVDDHIKNMAICGIDYSMCMLVTPTGEMRDAAIARLGPVDAGIADDAAGLGLDQKLLMRLDRNNVWGCRVGV